MIAQDSTRRDATRFVVLAAAVALAVFAADGLTKTMAASALALGDTYDVVPGWLVFTLVGISGAASGVLAG
jgi:lipoprotein signal peptidase